MPITARISTAITIATTSRVTSGQKRSALSTATEGQGAVLALPLCLEGLVFSPLAAADHPGCRNLSARAERFRSSRHTQREEGDLLGLVEEVVGRVRHKRLITGVC